MALFYRAKEGGRVVRAEAASDSKKVFVEEADGAIVEFAVPVFALAFDKVDDQAAAKAEFLPPAPVVVEPVKDLKKKSEV